MEKWELAQKDIERHEKELVNLEERFYQKQKLLQEEREQLDDKKRELEIMLEDIYHQVYDDLRKDEDLFFEQHATLTYQMENYLGMAQECYLKKCQVNDDQLDHLASDYYHQTGQLQDKIEQAYRNRREALQQAGQEKRF